MLRWRVRAHHRELVQLTASCMHGTVHVTPPTPSCDKSVINKRGACASISTNDTLLQLQLDIRCNTVSINTSHYTPSAIRTRHKGRSRRGRPHDVSIGETTKTVLLDCPGQTSRRRSCRSMHHGGDMRWRRPRRCLRDACVGRGSAPARLRARAPLVGGAPLQLCACWLHFECQPCAPMVLRLR